MKIAVCPGSFDPVTKGHINIVERASKLFDKVIVVVFINPNKTPTFTTEERVDFIKRCVKDLGNVEVDSYEGLLADYAKLVGANAVIKGLRAVSDFEYEFQQALANKIINPDMETLFLNTSQEYLYLSSSVVKQIAEFGGDISPFIPEPILDDITAKIRKEN